MEARLEIRHFWLLAFGFGVKGLHKLSAIKKFVPAAAEQVDLWLMKQLVYRGKEFLRRDFLRLSVLSSVAALGSGLSIAQGVEAVTTLGEEASLKGRLYKTLKFNMVKGGSILERFQMAKAAGFKGVELNVPGVSAAQVAEVQEAMAQTGLVVDGTVCSTHWKVRHSDPDAKVRTQALADLKQSLRETRALGGSTMLLVVGHGKDGTPEEVWERSFSNISQALPLAAELGVTIAIENVWNSFCYDHSGGATQTAEQLAKYVDAFDSPFVGMQFDIGNHWKYGNVGDWIRQLGKRIVKLDVKGFSREKNQFTKIGEGDVDFSDVRRALVEINFHGWCAAEVGGGGLARLKEISANMDRSFSLK